MNSKGKEFLEYSKDILDKLENEEWENISHASKAIAKTIENGGLLYTFGTGHSTILCQEMFFRAGCLANVYPILDERFMLHKHLTMEERMLERKEGIVKEIFDKYPLKKGDSMIIFCYSGINSTSIDAGMLCKELGVTSIAILSMEHSNSQESRHPSGKKFQDVCDIVIDNHGKTGDASIEIGDQMVSPISTLAGSAICQAIAGEVAEILLNDGVKPKLFKSMNVKGGDDSNNEILEKYGDIIKIL